MNEPKDINDIINDNEFVVASSPDLDNQYSNTAPSTPVQLSSNAKRAKYKKKKSKKQSKRQKNKNNHKGANNNNFQRDMV